MGSDTDACRGLWSDLPQSGYGRVATTRELPPVGRGRHCPAGNQRHWRTDDRVPDAKRSVRRVLIIGLPKGPGCFGTCVVTGCLGRSSTWSWKISGRA